LPRTEDAAQRDVADGQELALMQQNATERAACMSHSRKKVQFEHDCPQREAFREL
jgi:hypothetical protein